MKFPSPHLFASVVLLLLSPLSASAESKISADALLKNVREMSVSQGERDVMGIIRKGRNKVPFSLSARGNTIAFQYKPASEWKRFDVRINDKHAELIIVDKGKARVMPSSQYQQTIANTDVSFEDLSLRFLYWKGGKVIENSSNNRIKGRDCVIVEVRNPQGNVGEFSWVRIWIDKENGTTWQIDGYGQNGKLKKRFSITSVQKLSDDSWFFKQMKLEVRDPKNPSRTKALNYIEMDDIRKKK